MRAPVDWIPEVAKGANAFYDLEPGTMADLIYRLGTDKRLAGVWRTLAQARQDKDITALFGIAVCCAFACCNDMLTVIARRELEQTAARFRTTAQQLHDLAGLLRGHRDPEKRALSKAAKVCEGLASSWGSDLMPGLVVERKVDPKVRAYVVYLSTEVERVIGRPFDKGVGQIATVAFDLKKQISIRTVQYWRTHGGS